MANPWDTRLVGGVTTLGATATPIDVSGTVDFPCRQLVMRAEPNAQGIIYIGNSDVSANNAVGYFYARETGGFGPLSVGCGIYARTIYLLGNAGTKIYWWAFPS